MWMCIFACATSLAPRLGPTLRRSERGTTVDGINLATPGAAGMIVLLFEIRAFYLGALEPEHDFMMK